MALGSYNGKNGELAFQASKLGQISTILPKFYRFLATLAGFRASFAHFFRKVEPIPLYDPSAAVPAWTKIVLVKRTYCE